MPTAIVAALTFSIATAVYVVLMRSHRLNLAAPLDGLPGTLPDQPPYALLALGVASLVAVVAAIRSFSKDDVSAGVRGALVIAGAVAAVAIGIGVVYVLYERLRWQG